MSESPDPTTAVIGNVRALRKTRGWSARELSERLAAVGCQMPRSVLANMENGRRDVVTVAELYAFANVFEVSVPILLNGPECADCNDNPPAGFSCLVCEKESPR